MKAMVLKECCEIEIQGESRRIRNLPLKAEPLEKTELPKPEPESKQLLVKVSACGICHTELDEIEGRLVPPRFPIVLGHELLASAEWNQLSILHRRILDLQATKMVIREKEKETAIADADELAEHIIAAGKRNLSIQRYKGLGEMNPTQLWDTTMNPETRTLLRVNIEDAIETDEIFTVLMGDQVEPRRRFIEDNALNVKNLDI